MMGSSKEKCGCEKLKNTAAGFWKLDSPNIDKVVKGSLVL